MQLSGKGIGDFFQRKDVKSSPSNGINCLYFLTKVVNNEPFNQWTKIYGGIRAEFQ
jgi:hypothetical protein